MTYGEAKKNFALFAVFAPVKNKKGKAEWEEVDLDKETIPDDTEGQVGAYNYLGGIASVPRLCFILEEKE